VASTVASSASACARRAAGPGVQREQRIASLDVLVFLDAHILHEPPYAAARNDVAFHLRVVEPT